MNSKTITLEPLQIACMLRMIAHQIGDVDDDLNAGVMSETTAELLNDYRDMLSSLCDALTAD